MNYQKEIWKEIKGFEGMYEVSTKGRVRSIGREINTINNTLMKVQGRILNATPQTRGYLKVDLWKDGQSTTRTVHRLVMETFVDNPDNLPVINHIDENQTNNKLSNLEWTTYSHNQRHNNANVRRSKPVYLYNIEGQFIKAFLTVAQAAKELKIQKQGIWKNANKQLKTYKGYVFSYNFDFNTQKTPWNDLLAA